MRECRTTLTAGEEAAVRGDLERKRLHVVAGGPGNAGRTALAAAELTELSLWGQPQRPITVPGPQPCPAQVLLAPGGTEGQRGRMA